MKEKNLLIFHQGALGDVVTIFPALLQLRIEYRTIDAICQNKLGKLAAFFNLIDRDFPLESATVASLFSDPVHPKVQHIIGSYHTIVLFSYSSHLEHVMGTLTDGMVHRISPRPAADKQIHVTDHILWSLKSRGVIPAAHISRSAMVTLTSSSDLRDPMHDPSMVWIHPGSGSPRKNWPISYFIQTAETLKTDGMRPTFVLGPAEHHLERELQRHPLTYRTVDDLIALVNLLKTGGSLIGNDSGVTHLAAFMGLSTVAIFGPSDPLRWLPNGRSVRAVTPDIDCSPCFEIESDFCQSMDCLKRISPEKVLKAYYEMITADAGGHDTG